MIELIEPGFDEPGFEVPRAFFDGKPGLDVETKVVLEALFSETHMVKVFDYCGDLPSSEEE